MTENRTATGGRDDLVMDVSRCLKMRFSESSCRCCVEVCPHGAVTLDNGLAIDSHTCCGCLLCTAACPAGALEQKADFSACLAQLDKTPAPVLGCVRTSQCANGTVACLGGLAAEHLLALYHSLAGKLTLNFSRCDDCPNGPVVEKVRQRLDELADAGLSGGMCRIGTAESSRDVHYHVEAVDRRRFFTSFGKALFRNAAVILTASTELPERRSEYVTKRVPYKRKLLNSIRDSLAPEMALQVQRHFDSSVTFDGNCTGCHGCVAICPAGALAAVEPDSQPVFDRLACTGCGLCKEFCLEGAIAA